MKTILHHIREPWQWRPEADAYYFCDDPECEVVYFGQDDSVIDRSRVRTAVGIKEKTDTAVICYCFGVTVTEAATRPEIREYVCGQTDKRMCECKVRNPSGRCCLRDFPMPESR